jgi:hypothetical protein
VALLCPTYTTPLCPAQCVVAGAACVYRPCTNYSTLMCPSVPGCAVNGTTGDCTPLVPLCTHYAAAACPRAQCEVVDGQCAYLPCGTYNATQCGAVPHCFANVTSAACEPAALTWSVTTSKKYRGSVTVRAATARPLSRLRVVAYTDIAASGVGYATQSLNSTCAVRPANSSVGCALVALAAGGAWTFDLFVAPPRYFHRDVAVRIHLAADGVTGVEGSVVLSHHNTGVATPAPESPTGSAEDPVSMATAGRNIFSLDGGCTGTLKLPIVPITLLLFLVLLVVRVAHIALARRRPTDAEETTNVGALRGLLPQHIWLGAAQPCHRHCGPAHALLFLVHILVIMTIVAALVTGYPALAVGGVTAITAFGIFAIVCAACLQPVFAAAFDMFSLRAARDQAHAKDKYRPLDLMQFGVDKAGGIGLTSKTARRMVNVNYATSAVEDGGHQLPETRADEYLAGPAVPRHQGFVVESWSYTKAGFALCSVFALGLAAAAFVLMAPLCGKNLAAVELALAIAFAMDIAVAQPLFVAAVMLWRWLVSDRADGASEHSLHPIHGQRVYKLDADGLPLCDDEHDSASEGFVTGDDIITDDEGFTHMALAANGEYSAADDRSRTVQFGTLARGGRNSDTATVKFLAPDVGDDDRRSSAGSASSLLRIGSAQGEENVSGFGDVYASDEGAVEFYDCDDDDDDVVAVAPQAHVAQHPVGRLGNTFGELPALDARDDWRFDDEKLVTGDVAAESGFSDDGNAWGH